MKRFTSLLAVGALLMPGMVRAQAPSPSETDLRLEREHRRIVVRPSPPAETVEHDAAEVTAEVEQHRRQQDLVRDLRRPLPRRPDLDYDVKSGIQSRRLHNAIR